MGCLATHKDHKFNEYHQILARFGQICILQLAIYAKFDQVNREIGGKIAINGPILLLFLEPGCACVPTDPPEQDVASDPCEQYLRDPCDLDNKVRTCAPSSSLDCSGTSGTAGGGGDQWLIATRCVSTASSTSQQQYHASLIGFI
jgi:hypothetical protein